MTTIALPRLLSFARSQRRRARSTRVAALLSALALLVALQAIAGAVLATRGPLHTHRGDAATLGTVVVVVLEDFRRAPLPAASGALEAAALRHGHAHAGGAALRHHHAAADAGDVVVAATDGAGENEDAATLAATALAAAIGIVPQLPAWAAPGADDVRRAATPWAPRTRAVERLERPPRRA